MIKASVAYHGDHDGVCSAAIVWKWLQSRGYGKSPGEVEFVPAAYNRKLEVRGKLLFLVDFCVQPLEQMQELMGHYGKNMVWIDHHKTSLPLAHRVPGIINTEVSASALTWFHFYGARGLNADPAKHIEELPEPVLLVDRWDIWDHGHDDRVLPFEFGLRIDPEHMDPQSLLWEDLLSGKDGAFEHVDQIVCRGKIAYAYQRGQWDEMMQSHMRIGTIRTGANGADLPVAVANIPRPSSLAFENFRLPCRAVIAYSQHADGLYNYSIYTLDKELDVSTIAKAFEGGGHAGAAGWVSPHGIETFVQFP